MGDRVEYVLGLQSSKPSSNFIVVAGLQIANAPRRVMMEDKYKTVELEHSEGVAPDIIHEGTYGYNSIKNSIEDTVKKLNKYINE